MDPKQTWSLTTTIFALGMYIKLGEQSYNDLIRFVELPSARTLQRLCYRMQGEPGINDLAVKAFLTLEPTAGSCLAFDEIYLVQGFQ